MRIIHRIINFCITTTPKTEGAYYTQVRIISETLRYIYLTTFTTVLLSRTAVSAGLKQTGVVITPAVKFEMRIIHRIINFCITATLKTGGAYYTQVRIISETLR